jgi:hypothetical protein
VYLRSRWLTCCHNTISNQPDSTTRAIYLVAKQENITGEKQVRKFGRQSISLMLWINNLLFAITNVEMSTANG